MGPFGSFKLPQNPLPSWLDIMKKYKWERAIMVDGNNQTRGYLTYDQEMAIFSNIANELLKYGSQEKNSFCCRCSSFLSLTFVEIKKSFTEMLLSINYRNFEIFFSWKKTDIS